MGYEQILYEVKDRVATVTLNRPDKLNAWTAVMGREVRQAMDEAARDEAVRVIVLTGAGRGFCAGADMQMLSGIVGAGRQEPAEAAAAHEAAGDPAIRPDFRGAYAYFPMVPKPIIAALNGATAGLGLVVSLYCDLRIAADTAVFTTAFSRRGLIAEHGVSWMLPRLVGLQHAPRPAALRAQDHRGGGARHGPGRAGEAGRRRSRKTCAPTRASWPTWSPRARCGS